MIFNYVSAPCGAGKTWTLLDHAAKLAVRGNFVVIVQPTIELSTQSHADFQDRFHDISTQIINSETTDHSVYALAERARNQSDEGQVIFTTFASFERVQDFPNKEHTTLICDEIPQVIDGCRLNISDTYKRLTDVIDVEEFDASYYELVVSDQKGIEELTDSYNSDDLLKLFQDVTAHTTSEYWTYCVGKKHWNNILNDGVKKRVLKTFGVLNLDIFSGFKAVYVFGANFEDRLFGKLAIRDTGIDTKQHKILTNSLRYDQHSCGNRIKIYYAADLNWSKNFGSKGQNFDNIVASFKRVMADKRFLWIANKDKKRNLFPKMEATRITGSPIGLNEYACYHNICILAAYNPPSDFINFLKASYGFTDDDIRIETYYEAVYQFICRTSIRDVNATEPVTVCVCDKGLALWLASKFPGAQVEKLECDIVEDVKKKPGRKRVHSNDNERKLAYKKRQKLRLKEIGNDTVSGGQRCSDYSVAPHICSGDDFALEHSNFVAIASSTAVADTILDSASCKGDEITDFRGCIYKDVNSRVLIRKLDNISITEFEELLKSFKNRQFNDKFENNIITAAHFKEGEKCTESNIEYVSGIWLDNDGGGISESEFTNLFPDWRMTIYDTWSSTENDRRYRIYIPTTRNMTTEESRFIVDQIMISLRINGYESKNHELVTSGLKRFHGFDSNSFYPGCFSLLPCVNPDPKANSLTVYNDGRRKILNPDFYIENPLSDIFNKPTMKYPKKNRSVSLRKRIVDSAVSKWRSFPHNMNGANGEFFELGLKLATAGMDEREIENTLKYEARYARSPDKREKQVKSVISSLRKMGKLH